MKATLFQASIFFLAAIISQCSNNSGSATVIEFKHYKVPCQNGESTSLCYLVRNGNGDWEYFYDDISGFEFEWGYNYTLKVNVSEVENPMQDASSKAYSLVEVIKKEKALAGESFDLKLNSDAESFVTGEAGRYKYFDQVEILCEAIPCDALASSKTGTFQHGSKAGTIVLTGVK